MFLKSFKRLKTYIRSQRRRGPLGSLGAIRGHGVMWGRRPQMKFSPAGIVNKVKLCHLSNKVLLLKLNIVLCQTKYF